MFAKFWEKLPQFSPKLYWSLRGTISESLNFNPDLNPNQIEKLYNVNRKNIKEWFIILCLFFGTSSKWPPC